MYAVVSNLPPQACGLDYTHTGRVALWSFEANLKGFMYYGHTSLYSGHQFNVLFQDGGNLSNARLNSIGIGSTFDDGLTNSDNCWSGFHLHETNSNDANKKWDAWNSFYNTAATFCECHTNTASSNWIRRMTWTLVGFE